MCQILPQQASACGTVDLGLVDIAWQLHLFHCTNKTRPGNQFRYLIDSKQSRVGFGVPRESFDCIA